MRFFCVRSIPVSQFSFCTSVYIQHKMRFSATWSITLTFLQRIVQSREELTKKSPFPSFLAVSRCLDSSYTRLQYFRKLSFSTVFISLLEFYVENEDLRIIGRISRCGPDRRFRTIFTINVNITISLLSFRYRLRKCI